MLSDCPFGYILPRSRLGSRRIAPGIDNLDAVFPEGYLQIR